MEFTFKKSVETRGLSVCFARQFRPTDGLLRQLPIPWARKMVKHLGYALKGGGMLKVGIDWCIMVRHC